MTQRSKGQRSSSRGFENRQGRTVASNHGRYSVPTPLCYTVVLPEAVAGVDLHVDTTALLVTGYWCLTSLNIAEMISDCLSSCKRFR